MINYGIYDPLWGIDGAPHYLGQPDWNAGEGLERGRGI
jgi:hypothetical protein